MTVLVALAALAAGIVVASCSGSGGASSGSGSGTARDSAPGEPVPEDQKLTVGWIAVGSPTVAAVEGAFPNRIESLVAEDVSNPSSAASELASQGARLIVSGVPGTCASVPDVHCVEPAGSAQPAANTAAYGLEFWNTSFLLGRAAGLLTESDVTGFVAASDSPAEKAAVNSWALGCQTSNPNCVTRLALAAPGVAKQLLKAGADVLATTSSDGSICGPADKQGVPVFAVPPSGVGCADPIASVDLAPLFQKEVGAELDGSFAGGHTESLADPQIAWGDTFPADARAKVEAAAEGLAGGKKVFVGPLFDNQGEQQVPEGEELSPEFIASHWTWLLGGVAVQ
jgi:basic membrane protein A and related proteins